jgi:ribosomal protein L37E
MDLLTNALDSIRLGVEDYEAGTPARLLSAMRNIHAGILLLYKEALRRLSPPQSDDVLIKVKSVPVRDASGVVSFVGKRKKTVDVQQIRERFDGLGIKTDWTRFDRITEVRNDLEHYFSQLTQAALQGLITDSFLIIRNFIANELAADPRALLGEDAWQVMLGVSEVFQVEQKACEEALSKIDWASEALEEGLATLSCRNCGSQLLKPDQGSGSFQDAQLVCSACGFAENYDSYVPRAISEALDSAAYIAAKDGGDTPYVDCPECGVAAYVVEENRCAACGESVETTCIRCGSAIPPEELDSSPMCGWCAHMSSKDD